MKKIISFIIILLGFIPIACAIALTIPEQRDYFFEPDSILRASYSIGNSDPNPINVVVTVNAGPLNEYVTTKTNTLTIPAFSSETFVMELQFPSQLKEGIYSIRIDVSEQAAEGGMAGLTGVADVINIISPYSNGYPYYTVLVDQIQQPGRNITFNMIVQNIGKTPLQDQSAQAELRRGDNLDKIKLLKNIPLVEPFQKIQIRETIDAESLEQGKYTLNIKMKDQTLSQEFVLGQPTLRVIEVPKLNASKQNDFVAKMVLDDWTTPVENAYVRFHVNMIMNLVQKITLYPGENDIKISTTAKPGKTGNFQGNVEMTGNMVRSKTYFTADVEGSVQGGATRFKKTLSNGTVEDEPEPKEATTPQVKLQEKPKENQIFFIVLLVLSIVIFAFALGRYLGRRKNDDTQISPPNA